MKLQYISDSQGVTTGVLIPISEWNDLKEKYQDIEGDETSYPPQWHKDIVNERLKDYEKPPQDALDFDDSMEEIERNL
jgi:hypothetical protein